MKTIKIMLGKGSTFFEEDVYGAMDALGWDIDKIPVVYLYTNEGSMEDKDLAIQRTLSSLDLENCLIIADAYVSTIEFPEEKYGSEGPDSKIMKSVLKRESKLLESHGFISVNDYVGYESKVAFVYGNELGLQLRGYFTQLLEDKED